MSEGNTKNALAAAMRALLETESFSSVTVGDICAKCGMNRKSFYYHFRDKYDLVCWMFYTEFFDSLQDTDGPNAPDILKSLCEFLEQNLSFYRAVLKVEGQNSLREYMGEMLRPVIVQRLERRFGRDPDQMFYIELHTALWRDSICRWVLGGCAIAADKFTRLMYTASASISEVSPK